jgi:hypothetical protein
MEGEWGCSSYVGLLFLGFAQEEVNNLFFGPIQVERKNNNKKKLCLFAL